MKAGSQPGNSKADGDSVAVKIGPSTLGGSPVRRSPRVLTNKKPSSSPLLERSLLKQNKKHVGETDPRTPMGPADQAPFGSAGGRDRTKSRSRRSTRAVYPASELSGEIILLLLLV